MTSHVKKFETKLSSLDTIVEEIKEVQTKMLADSSHSHHRYHHTTTLPSRLTHDTSSYQSADLDPPLADDEVESLLSSLGGENSSYTLPNTNTPRADHLVTPIMIPPIMSPPTHQIPWNFSLKERGRVEKWVEEGFSEFLQPEEIVSKYNFNIPLISWEEWKKLGLQLAKNHFFGERLLA